MWLLWPGERRWLSILLKGEEGKGGGGGEGGEGRGERREKERKKGREKEKKRAEGGKTALSSSHGEKDEFGLGGCARSCLLRWWWPR